jgi:hypothetical protein
LIERAFRSCYPIVPSPHGWRFSLIICRLGSSLAGLSLGGFSSEFQQQRLRAANWSYKPGEIPLPLGVRSPGGFSYEPVRNRRRTACAAAAPAADRITIRRPSVVQLVERGCLQTRTPSGQLHVPSRTLGQRRQYCQTALGGPARERRWYHLGATASDVSW